MFTVSSIGSRAVGPWDLLVIAAVEMAVLSELILLSEVRHWIGLFAEKNLNTFRLML